MDNKNLLNLKKTTSYIKNIFSFIFSPIFKRKSIKSKINILILFIEIISMSVFSLMSINILLNDKLFSLKDRMEKVNEKLNIDVKDDFENIIIRDLSLIEDDPITQSYIENFDVNLLENLFGKFKDVFYEISFVKKNGMEDVIVINGNRVIDKEYKDYNTNKYFINLRDKEQINYILTEEFLIEGIPHVQLFYKCLDKYHDVYAYLSVIFKIDKIIKRIIDQKYEKTGFTFLANSSGIILYHPNKENIFKKLSEKGNENSKIITSIINLEKNFLKAELNKITGYIQYIPIVDFNWSVISVMPLKEFNKSINNIIFITILIIIFTIILSLLIINFIINLIIKPLSNVIFKMRDISEGRILNNEIIQKKQKDEIGVLIDAFNNILIALNVLVKQANAIADGDLKSEIFKEEFKGDLGKAFSIMISNLTEIITNTKEITINLNSSSKEIEAASQEQTSASNEHASGITEVSATLEELTITAKQITKNVGELVYSSEEVIKLLQESEKQLVQTVDQLEDVGKISKNNTNEIGELGKRSILINEMVELIKEVANKTNILSINASIEASRSGEAGTGFSVVAAEIRELSKETIASAKNVEKAAREIQDFLNSIIISSESESAKVIESGKIVKTIYDNIGSIVGKINNNYTFTQKIDVSIKQQESGSKQAADTMKQMAEIARQSAETARQTLLAVKDIVNFSTGLDEVIKKFKLDDKNG